MRLLRDWSYGKKCIFPHYYFTTETSKWRILTEPIIIELLKSRLFFLKKLTRTQRNYSCSHPQLKSSHISFFFNIYRRINDDFCIGAACVWKISRAINKVTFCICKKIFNCKFLVMRNSFINPVSMTIRHGSIFSKTRHLLQRVFQFFSSREWEVGMAFF